MASKVVLRRQYTTSVAMTAMGRMRPRYFTIFGTSRPPNSRKGSARSKNVHTTHTAIMAIL